MAASQPADDKRQKRDDVQRGQEGCEGDPTSPGIGGERRRLSVPRRCEPLNFSCLIGVGDDKVGQGLHQNRAEHGQKQDYENPR